MEKLGKNILIDLSAGGMIGFSILHPVSMLIQHGVNVLQHPIGHYFFSSMSLYFTLLGCFLGILSGVFRIKLQNQNVRLKEQQKIINEQNQSFEASITYARHIQDSMFTKEQEIKQYLPECFILHKPKDIIGGDLYWFRKIKGKYFFAAIDCTGHGVPGAVLSMIANDLLNEIVTEFKIYSPDLVLNKLHLLFRQTLHQDKNGNMDGLDIALCCFDKKARRIEYAGAKNPLIYIQNKQIQIIKGDRISIGGYNGFNSPGFTKHILTVNEPSVFYIFTDGFQDQFGYDDKGKFKSHRFRKLLLKIHELPYIRQKLELDRTFESWRSTEPQTDDVLVIGFKVG